MFLTHKIALKPNRSQRRYFERAAGCDRFCWNMALEEWNRRYELQLECEKRGESIPEDQKCNLDLIKKEFNAMKYDAFPWMSDIHKDAHSDAFYRLRDAWVAFFRNPKKTGRPKFHKKNHGHGHRDYFYLSNNVIRFDGKRMFFPKIFWVRMTEELRYNGKIMSAVVTRTADRWFVSVKMEIPDEKAKKPRVSDGIVGVDCGINNAVVLSTGEAVRAPKPFVKCLKKLRKLTRKSYRQRKFGSNQARTYRRIAKVYARCANIRRDFWNKISTKLCRENQAIAVENLNVQGMMGNRCVSRALADVSFGMLKPMLEYKAKIYGCQIVVADRWFPSSKTCSTCGHVKKIIWLENRMFRCDQCGAEIDRDLNAAINIKNQIRPVGPESMPADCDQEVQGRARSRKYPVRKNLK